MVEIPSSINEYTNVEFFPHADDINQLLFISESFKEALCQISAKGADSTDDELSDIAIVFLGVWRGINTNSRVRLSEIVEKAGRISNFNLSIYSDIEIKSGCESILDAIDGFEYKIRGRDLVWSLGFVSGSCRWTVQLENEILSTCPTTKRAIVALLK